MAKPEGPQDRPGWIGKRRPPRERPDRDVDDRPVTRRQARYLAEVTGQPVDELAGQRLGQLEGLLERHLDPSLLLLRRVCGRVVRTDPATGIVRGVPDATVQVEDTDCSFLGFFPVESPWWWLWPVWCSREVIAETVTDECGRFCVWIPRWDIDRILRWRRERVCLPDIVLPEIRDLLELVERPFPPRPPRPEPDPPPLHLDHDILTLAGDMLPPGVRERLELTLEEPRFGRRRGAAAELLDLPAFGQGEFPPAVDDERLEGLPDVEGIDPKELRSVVRGPALGPFLRCHDVYVAEWEVVFDVPDITFRVTQDVDGDGDQEVIYAEGLFDVRWNVGTIPSPTIQAWPGARVSETCDGPDIPCADEPAIRTVGLMPLEPSHLDPDGYSTRVNRPRPGGLTSSPPSPCGSARSPFAGTLQLHGCHHLGDAQHYRLTYQYRPTLADTLSGEVPFTSLSWWAPLLIPGGPRHITPDADGWYVIQPEDEMVFPHWLLNWPTHAFPDGQYVVRLYLGDGSTPPAPISGAVSDPVAFVVDNRAPNAGFTPGTLRWRVVGEPTWRSLPSRCPVIRRPSGAIVEIRTDWWANAVHLRNATLGASGCGGGAPQQVLPAPSDFDHWHTSPSDNAMLRTATYRLQDGSGDPLPAGSYSLRIDAHTRAFNPAGDGGGPSVNWCTDYAYKHAHPSVAIAVVDV